MIGGTAAGGVRVWSFLEATGHPVMGGREKPTFILEGNAIAQTLHIEVVKKTRELRFGCIHRTRYARLLDGSTFHSPAARDCTGFVCARSDSIGLQHGDGILAQLAVVVRDGSRVELRLSQQHPPQLEYSIDGKACPSFSMPVDEPLEYAFAVQFFDHGDCARVRTEASVALSSQQLQAQQQQQQLQAQQQQQQLQAQQQQQLQAQQQQQQQQQQRELQKQQQRPQWSVSPEQKTSSRVRIVHMSDTHGMHRHIHDLPAGDILIHTGDFTNQGTDAEFADFNQWLGEIRHLYQHVIVICGNHEWNSTWNVVAQGAVPPQMVLADNWFRSRLTNCTFLNQELVEVMGLRIYGSSFVGWHDPSRPGKAPRSQNVLGMLWASTATNEKLSPVHFFDKIPVGTDLLLTHGPAEGILDTVAPGCVWGSSSELAAAVMRVKPRVHLFGHLHEQRGVWRKQPDGTYTGGIEYSLVPGGPVFGTLPPPHASYPCELICNTALSGVAALEGVDYSRLAGRPRVITANRVNETWRFST